MLLFVHVMSNYEDLSLLECDAVSLGFGFTFWKFVAPSSSGSRSPRSGRHGNRSECWQLL